MISVDENISSSVVSPGLVINETALNANIQSPVIRMRTVDRMSVQVDRGAGLIGTLALMCSNDNVTFYAASNTEFAAIDGNAGGEAVDFYNLQFEFYRFDFTRTGGPGSLKVNVKVKP